MYFIIIINIIHITIKINLIKRNLYFTIIIKHLIIIYLTIVFQWFISIIQ